MEALPKKRAICVDITTGAFDEQIKAIAAFGKAKRSSYACHVNVHMTVEAWNDESFRRVVNEADFATADGMPVLKALNKFNQLNEERVAGNDVMPAIMREAEVQGLSVFFYGGQQEVLDTIVAKAKLDMPRLKIAGACSPPYRALSTEEMDGMAQMINESGANIVLVSLGCPKQEKWMAAMKGKVNATMLGVGGAFLLYAGVDTRAPKWMRDMSMEWLYRLALEPRRLFKRYFITNSTFVFLFLKHMIVNK